MHNKPALPAARALFRFAGPLLVALYGANVSAQISVDGDTAKINGQNWRLQGIDAAEKAQVCSDGWRAGEEATAFLSRLMAGKGVSCDYVATDRYNRPVGICYAAGRDLGADMVRNGMAWAFRRYSLEYLPQESAAKAERLGVHARDCEPPWDFRARLRR